MLLLSESVLTWHTLIIVDWLHGIFADKLAILRVILPICFFAQPESRKPTKTQQQPLRQKYPKRNNDKSRSHLMLVAEREKGGAFYFNLPTKNWLFQFRERPTQWGFWFWFWYDMIELYHDDEVDLLASPVIELDHKVEEVGFAEIWRRLLRELCASDPTPANVIFVITMVVMVMEVMVMVVLVVVLVVTMMVVNPSISNKSEGGEVNWLEQDWSGKRICNGPPRRGWSSSQCQWWDHKYDHHHHKEDDNA